MQQSVAIGPLICYFTNLNCLFMENSTLQLVSYDWDSEALLSLISISDIPRREELRNERREKLWKDTYAEYDARHLAKEIYNRNIIESPEMDSFLSLWASDEVRHTKGFVSMLDLITGLKPEDSMKMLDERLHDFEDLNFVLGSEFKTLTAIAFDEIVTCNAYNEDKEFYESLGSPVFVEWLMKLIGDEAAHFRNAVDVIRECHSHRIGEIPRILDELVTERKEDDYKGTFILDHFGDDYTMDLLNRSRDSLLSYVYRA
jgi:hypothetical protein